MKHTHLPSPSILTTASKKKMKQPQPFTIDIAQTELDDLKSRLQQTRWPDEEPNAGWTMGTNLSYMKELAAYWSEKYNWRTHEAYLNQLKQYTVEVDGIKLHFIHEKGKGSKNIPILLLHGWPDSFYRFHRLIPFLTDPDDEGSSFDVIVPSIPGTGFSDRKALSPDALASFFHKLMTEILGYQTFATSGGDGGTLIIKSLALHHPESLVGIHLTDVGYPDFTTDHATLSPAEKEFAGFIHHWWMKEGAFAMIQSTKPQSLSYGMNDSPVALAAWIMGFICMGSTIEEIEKRFTREELLTNIMIYWVTQTIGSSFRWYYEIANETPSALKGQKSQVPAAVARCPWDAPLPKEWAARNVNLKQYTEFPRGGHFTAWEEPELYAADLRDFFVKMN